MDIEEILSSLTRDHDDEPASEPLNRATRAAQLKEQRASFEKRHTFTPGDLVQLKAGMQITRAPNYGEPAIVTEVLNTPLVSEFEKQAGTPYFRQPLDIKIAIIDEDGDFLEYFFDSRRLEPYTGETL